MQKILEAAQYIKERYSIVPKIVIVLGSGLNDYAEAMTDAVTIPYNQIPNFPKGSVVGHKYNLILGKLHEIPVAVLQGRLHYYEGFTPYEIVLPVRALKIAGAEILLLTNASGGINRKFSPGDLMLIRDHINLSGTSPLIGTNLDELGTRFPDMSKVYDEQLSAKLRQCADEKGILLQEGVYVMFNGPQFETPAEIRFAQSIGADAVGMSTVFEAIAARHAGYRICGISCITNMAAGILDKPLSHHEVIETGLKSHGKFTTLIDSFIKSFK